MIATHPTAQLDSPASFGADRITDDRGHGRSVRGPVPVDAAVELPEGTPEWIAEDLIRATIGVWQPYSVETITPEDAVALLENVGRLFGVIAQESSS